MAQEAGMDLVEVAPREKPPVCRLMDYGKFKYRQKKQQRKSHHHETQLKEVRFRPKTDGHDRDVKIQRAKDFLGKGDKVQFTMLFRGRERFHQELGRLTFAGIVEEFADTAKLEREPRMEGPRRLTMILAPNKPGAGKPEAAKPEAAEPEVAKPEAAKPEAD